MKNLNDKKFILVLIFLIALGVIPNFLWSNELALKIIGLIIYIPIAFFASLKMNELIENIKK